MVRVMGIDALLYQLAARRSWHCCWRFEYFEQAVLVGSLKLMKDLVLSLGVKARAMALYWRFVDFLDDG